MISPSHRYETVLALANNKSPAPVDAVMAELYALFTGAPTASAAVQYAWDLFKNESHRAILDAFFLCKATPDLVSRTLDIAQPVVDAYAYLFMDVSALRNRLEALAYANDYNGDKSAKDLMRVAMTIGLEYLLWLQGVVPDIEPRAVVRRTMVDAFYRGMAHKGNSLTTGVAKEALKWWSVAISNAKLLESIDPRATKAAYEELRIALEGHDETLTPATAPVALADMLH